MPVVDRVDVSLAAGNVDCRIRTQLSPFGCGIWTPSGQVSESVDVAEAVLVLKARGNDEAGLTVTYIQNVDMHIQINDCMCTRLRLPYVHPSAIRLRYTKHEETVNRVCSHDRAGTFARTAIARGWRWQSGRPYPGLVGS